MEATSEKEKEAIVNDFKNGLKIADLCTKHKRSYGNVTKILILSDSGYKPKSKYEGRIKEFVCENYIKNGAEFCAKELGMSVRMIKEVATRYGAVRNPIVNFKQDFNENFIVDTPELSYVLGLLWADGHITCTPREYRVSINNIYDDLITVQDVFFQMGNWNIQTRNRKNRRPQLALRAGSKIFCSFLRENDYVAKSHKSADKILSKIPDYLNHYFFRGLSDGDGCFSVLKGNSARFICASCFDQNWSYFENLCKQLDIKFSIRRRTWFNKKSQKQNSSSIIDIGNLRDVVKFGNYIYQNYENDKIGFPRKYEKFLEAKNKVDCLRQEFGELFDTIKHLRLLNSERDKKVFYLFDIDKSQTIEVIGLKKFSKEKSLTPDCLRKLLSGKRSIYKNYRIATIEEVNDFKFHSLK